MVKWLLNIWEQTKRINLMTLKKGATNIGTKDIPVNIDGSLFINEQEVFAGGGGGNIYTEDGEIDSETRTFSGINSSILDFKFYDTSAADFTSLTAFNMTEDAIGITWHQGDGAGNITSTVGISVFEDDLIATDTVSGFGIIYDTDYSSTFISRSLPDKNYVDNFAPRIAFSATNDTTTLGFGSLYANTTVTAKTLTITSADIARGSSTLPWFFTVNDEFGAATVNNITIDTEGAETINGGPSVAIQLNFGSINLYSDGSNLFTA